MPRPVARRLPAAVLLLLACLPSAAPPAAAGPEPAPHGAGIAVIASNIGNDYRVDDLAAFVEVARIRDVIVDWAWITAHWDTTRFDRVNDLVLKLKRRGVRVAAMYRPRFFPREIGKYDVAYQLDERGEPNRGFCEIRYSDPAARRWGTEWSVRILTRCPAFDEIVIYNPTQTGRSPEVTAGRERDPDFDHRCVRIFLEETRAAARKIRKDVRLGLVLPPDRSVYDRYAEAVDVARPFLFVREWADFATDRDHALEVAPEGPALAKITWGEDERVSDERLGDFIRTAREKKLPFVFWTFWTAFCSGNNDLGLLCRALEIDAKKIRPIIRSLGGVSGLPWDPVVVRKAVREVADDPGDDGYAKMHALSRRYGEDAVGPLCELLDDRGESVTVRWMAAGALGGTGSAKAVPCLLKHSHDPSDLVRLLCAESLGYCGRDSAPARKRLAEMASEDRAWRKEEGSDEKVWFVRDTARRALELLGELPADVWKGCAVVAVKDFMRIENSGDAVEKLEFPRYFPVIDTEQFVLGRWVDARTDDGKAVPIDLAGVSADPAGNLLHTWRIERMPARTGVVVTVTSLVLRRERPAPEGRFPIVTPDTQPEAVRPYLRSTAAVVADHPYVRAAASKILARTRDAYEIAAEVAALMKGKGYRQQGTPDPRLPAAAIPLRHGGSCCISAVTAAAVLRSCGIPAQITYCPAGYIHGIVRFHLEGYGWCRMDSTCGTGRLPLVEEREHRGLVRLYDMPIEMEEFPGSWGWPYQHATIDSGRYEFRSGGEVVPSVRFADRDEAQARREKRPSGHVEEPFPHLVSGSWNTVLAVERWKVADRNWDVLVAASRTAARTGRIGEFPTVLRLLRRYAGKSWFEERLRELEGFGGL